MGIMIITALRIKRPRIMGVIPVITAGDGVTGVELRRVRPSGTLRLRLAGSGIRLWNTVS
jgi:hypothetical protein